MLAKILHPDVDPNITHFDFFVLLIAFGLSVITGIYFVAASKSELNNPGAWSTITARNLSLDLAKSPPRLFRLLEEDTFECYR